MPDNEIPPAEQSVAKMIDLQHQIAEETLHGTSVGKIISPPPDIQFAWNIMNIRKLGLWQILKKGDLVEVTTLKGD